MSSFEPHFQHRQSAHCESGVMASLLSHAGLPMSEPMAFGLASGLAFAYLPIVKLSGMPLIAYRMPPKAIIKGLRFFVKPIWRAIEAQVDAGYAAPGRPVFTTEIQSDGSPCPPAGRHRQRIGVLTA